MVNTIKKKITSFFSDGHTRDITKWASISFALKIGATALQFIFVMLLSRALGADGMGKYSLCLSIIMIASIFGNIGIDKALLRFVPVLSANEEWTKVKKVFNLGSIVAILASLVISTILWFASDWLFTDILGRESLGEYLRWFILAIIPLAFIANLTEAFKGLKMITTSLLLRSFIPIIGIVGIYLLVPHFGLKGIIWTYDIAVFIIAIGGLLMWYFGSEKLKRPTPVTHTEPFGYKPLFNTSFPLYGLAIFQQVIVSAPIVLLGIWVEDNQTGQFFNAQKVSIMTSLFLIAFNTILASKVGQFFAKNKLDVLEITVQKATLLVSVLAAPLFLFLFFFSDFTMSIFGEDFRGGGILLQILLIGKFVSVVLGPVGLILIVGGRERIMRNTVVISALLIIIINVILLPRIGVMGAAIASSVAVTAQNLLAAFYVHKEFKIITIPTFLIKTTINKNG